MQLTVSKHVSKPVGTMHVVVVMCICRASCVGVMCTVVCTCVCRLLSVSLLVVSTVSLLANAVLVCWLCSHRAASRGSRSHDSHSGRDQRTLYRMSASNLVNSDDEDNSEEETVTSSFTRR
jgi:hypothetical protein